MTKVPRAFTPTNWGKKSLLGKDFELWPKISMQRNMILTIKKPCQSTGTPLHDPKFGKGWSTNSWERLASFAPPKFARRMSSRLTFATYFGLIRFARWRLCLTQMSIAWLASVRLRAGRAHAGLRHAYCFGFVLRLIRITYVMPKLL